MLGFSSAQVQSPDSAAGGPSMQTGNPSRAYPTDRPYCSLLAGQSLQTHVVLLSSVPMCQSGFTSSQERQQVCGYLHMLYEAVATSIESRDSAFQNLSVNTMLLVYSATQCLSLHYCMCVKSTFTAVAESEANHKCSAHPSSVPELELFLICFVLTMTNGNPYETKVMNTHTNKPVAIRA